MPEVRRPPGRPPFGNDFGNSEMAPIRVTERAEQCRGRIGLATQDHRLGVGEHVAG